MYNYHRNLETIYCKVLLFPYLAIQTFDLKVNLLSLCVALYLNCSLELLSGSQVNRNNLFLKEVLKDNSGSSVHKLGRLIVIFWDREFHRFHNFSTSWFLPPVNQNLLAKEPRIPASNACDICKALSKKAGKSVVLLLVLWWLLMRMQMEIIT